MCRFLEFQDQELARYDEERQGPPETKGSVMTVAFELNGQEFVA